MGDVTKKCGGPCGEEKNISCFGVCAAGKYGRRGQCKICYNAANKHYNRTRLYGITREEFDLLVKEAAGLCGICRKLPLAGEDLCVDHDHGSGKIRGLLCKGCNLGIAKLGDNAIALKRTLHYLKSSKAAKCTSFSRKPQRKRVQTVTRLNNGILERNCTECAEIKALEDFGLFSAGTFGRRTICRECYKVIAASWSRRKNYGIADEEYERLLAIQNGLCGICQQAYKQNLCVDHDHFSKVVRGLLCQHCNMGLGKLGDTLERVENAHSYLSKG